ncbi:hypothetical protein GOODEAATRI_002559 [Goodea atripinnis]|uniref:Uncharacterized protein n=1 Tax=Goodea atripinnis TaxID=208336 RepID=A0ABV0MNQ3_9TELE
MLVICLFATFKGSESESVLLVYQCISLFITMLMLSVGNRVAATVDSTVSGLIQSNESPVPANTWFLQLTDGRDCGELHLSAGPACWMEAGGKCPCLSNIRYAAL